MVNRYYTTYSSPHDTFTIVWKEFGSELKIERIILSDSEVKSENKAFKSFKQIKLGSSSLITALANKIRRYFNGKNVKFDLGLLNLDRCFKVQKKVLIAEYQIPKGWISTYKRIAEKIGIHYGARVVGNTLARNPFPIVVPCHRTIRTNGKLGGFQGGVNMKRALLEMEGIRFSEKGKVITRRLYY